MVCIPLFYIIYNLEMLSGCKRRLIGALKACLDPYYRHRQEWHRNFAADTVMPFSMLRSACQACLDFLLPPVCPLTAERVDRPGMIAPSYWARLRFIRPPFCVCCGIPSPHDMGGGAALFRCVACLEDPPIYDEARAALVYDAASRPLVLRFKHADQTHLARSFAPWMKQAGAEILQAGHVIVPVPMPRWRLWLRRYNQAAILAREVARESGGVLIVDALAKVRRTERQERLGRADRLKNLVGAFMLRPAYAAQVRGAHIVLVDDVMTTGATANACAVTLKKAGAARVSVLTLARTLKE